MKKNQGFTLIELLVVVGIIGILAAIVLASLNNAKIKSNDKVVMSNMGNAKNQGEIFYGTNTAVPDSYTNVCTNGLVGGVKGVGAMILAAARAQGLTSVVGNGTAGSALTATCHDSASAWAAEVPLKETAGTMWCVDSLGKNLITTGSTLTTGVDTVCN